MRFTSSLTAVAVSSTSTWCFWKERMPGSSSSMIVTSAVAVSSCVRERERVRPT
jgi:hypothetical protein